MKPFSRFISHWQNWLGLLLVLFFVAVAVAAPLLSPEDERTEGPYKRVGRATDLAPQPPDETSILGTLPGQLDVYHTLVWGARDALQFGLLVAGGALLFGVFFGAVAGYAGGIANGLMMRVSDAFLTFPALAGVVFLQQLLAVTIESMGGIYFFNTEYFGKLVYFEFTPPPFAAFLMKVDPVLISLILFSWMPIARLVNTLVLTLKRADFIQAARALGASPFWTLRRHLIPNAVGPSLVLAARDVGNAVILQATITFIGLGGESPWGVLLSLGRNWVIGPGGSLLDYWWVYVPATLAVILFGLAWNLLGDGLNEVMNPESQEHAEHSSRAQRKKEKKKEESPGDATVTGLSLVAGPGSIFAPHPVLASARHAVGHRDFESSLRFYSHLIDQNRYINDVIRDLAQIARKYPGEPQVWRVLGDALARNGENEDARRAYAKAQQLIRR